MLKFICNGKSASYPIVYRWTWQLFTMALLFGYAFATAAHNSSLKAWHTQDLADESSITSQVNGSATNLVVDDRVRDLNADALISQEYGGTKERLLRTQEQKRRTSPLSCSDVQIRDRFGTISSPGYPNRRSNSSSITNCKWTIHVTGPSDVLTISFDDLHLAGPKCPQLSNASCCTDWIQVHRLDQKERIGTTGKDMHYCGGDSESLIQQPFISEGIGVQVVLSARTGSSIRGFHLTYSVASKQSVVCPDGEFRCASGKCIPNVWRCDRKNECSDGSDEADCGDVCSQVTDVRCDPLFDGTIGSPGCYSFSSDRCDGKWDCPLTGTDEKGCNGCPSDMFSCMNGRSCFSERKKCDGIPDCGLDDFTDEVGCGLCPADQVLCDPSSSSVQCYDPVLDRCNGQADCPNAIDEMGCRNCGSKILCASGMGCYERNERCNAIPECSDYSDEKNCSSQTCQSEHGSFLCANGRCIRAAWVCDRSNDCGDASDELSCLKNSVITAAIMGSLISGLLLVIAVSCACKFIASRAEDQSCTRNRPDVSHRTSDHLFRLEPDTFFFRDPPPSYTAAVSNVPVVVQSGDRRRSRRTRRQRRSPPVPPSDLPVVSADATLLTDDANLFASEESTTRTEQETEVNDKSMDESCKNEGDDGTGLTHGTSDPDAGSLVNIELDSIATVDRQSECECDQEPLLN